ncbi:hypothetical protein CP981_24195 [Streptomyces platensis]|uniref:Uncharacterized protein n=1 Tax=Streptomyces platensis TaxID=58346 RepID=A0AAE6TP94_STRPT|nr:hypothetical protein [Streptomyces platensis]OSY45691.1 hypothetical protein BG653_02981 [Streptomyces platensis]QEV54315.1 hypothetical protein CP981_24195 [Streptomyces platensis]BCK69052.1 hypothetical protein Srufu_030050 [Streptomyces libani subsp. rufus]
MGKHFKVDLDELDGVVRQLRHLQHDMNETGQNVEYGTNIPKSAFGINFGEAEEVSHAHDRMQTYLKDVVKALQDLTHKFGEKTESSRGAYEDQDHETKVSMNG